MEDFAIFARGVFGEIFPSSLPVLTGANNTTIEISVRKITIRQKTSDSLWRIRHMCSIEKESSELYWGLNFFFFPVTDMGENSFKVICVPENMMIFYAENFDGEKTTKVTHALSIYHSLLHGN